MHQLLIALVFIAISSKTMCQTIVIYGDTNYMKKEYWSLDSNHSIIDSGYSFHLKDELPTGYYEVYYDKDTSLLFTCGYFINRRKVYKWQTYDRKGKLISETYYGNGGVGFVTYGYKNSKLNIIISKNSKFELDGTLIWYFENGQIKEIANYKNGKRHGLQHFFYENGNLSEQGYFINGHSVGIWSYYNKKGKLIREQESGIIPEYIKEKLIR
jgi:antitoxin component YwqK of YwqJK toxin-antitoxin module